MREVLPEARPSTRYSRPPCHPDEVQPLPQRATVPAELLLASVVFLGLCQPYLGALTWVQGPTLLSGHRPWQDRARSWLEHLRPHASCLSADSTEVPKAESSPEPPPGQGRTRAGTQVPVLGPEDDLAGIFLQVQGLLWDGPSAAPLTSLPSLCLVACVYHIHLVLAPMLEI